MKSLLLLLLTKHISNRICYDKKNEKVIGPHRCVQTVVVRVIGNNQFFIIMIPMSHMTKDLLFKIIEELHTIGFNVISMVNDMGPSNFVMHQGKITWSICTIKLTHGRMRQHWSLISSHLSHSHSLTTEDCIICRRMQSDKSTNYLCLQK
ncbi:hypothetical protein ACI65C_000353 [Semiaphis heraclei]